VKRILFVDDEPALLEALRRRLYRAMSKWEMTFVPSAALAIEQLEAMPYDVIVTDMRMARMDGAQLLEIVSTRSPETIRIVLSGYAEERQVMRLVPLAHRYVAKPCEPDRLEEVIERCLRLQGLLQEPRVRAIVGRIRQLPALPRVYARLREVIAREEATSAEVAEVIACDSAVTAKVLHVVNSAFFRLARPITRVEQAVVHLGFTAIRNLTLSAEVFSAWAGATAAGGIEPERLQEHARNVAAGAYALAAGQPWADDALLAGLLHDIGYWVLLQQCPQEVAQTVALAKEQALPLCEAERAVLDATHAEVGAYLLGLWGLPYPILEAVAFHHTPSLAPHSEFDLLAAVAVSQAITTASEPLHDQRWREELTPAVGAPYLAALGAPFSWAEAERRVRESCTAEEHPHA
jgi:HD-like signal output (HDOD) protein/ActR/RegA family two-component response regulator